MFRSIRLEFSTRLRSSAPLRVGATLLACAAAATLLAACESPRDRKIELDPQEQRLVHELVELVRVRVERTRDPARADSILTTLAPLYDDQERESLLDRLALDTPRGAAVMAAVHDSLEALRDRLFPPGSSFETTSSSGDARSGTGRRKTP